MPDGYQITGESMQQMAKPAGRDFDPQESKTSSTVFRLCHLAVAFARCPQLATSDAIRHFPLDVAGKG